MSLIVQHNGHFALIKIFTLHQLLILHALDMQFHPYFCVARFTHVVTPNVQTCDELEREQDPTPSPCRRSCPSCIVDAGGWTFDLQQGQRPRMLPRRILTLMHGVCELTCSGARVCSQGGQKSCVISEIYTFRS
jgi:hypothetical protein